MRLPAAMTFSRAPVQIFAQALCSYITGWGEGLGCRRSGLDRIAKATIPPSTSQPSTANPLGHWLDPSSSEMRQYARRARHHLILQATRWCCLKHPRLKACACAVKRFRFADTVMSSTGSATCKQPIEHMSSCDLEHAGHYVVCLVLLIVDVPLGSIR
jgi:hypothetical protein